MWKLFQKCSEFLNYEPKISTAKILSETDIRQRPYLSQMADNQTKQSTLFSRTLKVGEKNVPSEIKFLPYIGWDMAIF